MCDQQRLRLACAYVQSDQRFFSSLEYSMSVNLLTEQILEALNLKGGFTSSSESTLVKMSNCWKSDHNQGFLCSQLRAHPNGIKVTYPILKKKSQSSIIFFRTFIQSPNMQATLGHSTSIASYFSFNLMAIVGVIANLFLLERNCCNWLP